MFLFGFVRPLPSRPSAAGFRPIAANETRELAQLFGSRVAAADEGRPEREPAHALRMRHRVPDQCVLVGESGIKTHDDVMLLESGGVDAMLVGESLTREPDIGVAVDQLLGR